MRLSTSTPLSSVSSGGRRTWNPAALLLALLAASFTPALASAKPGASDESQTSWFRYGLGPAERPQPPPGPTRDQTSPFGLEVSVAEMARHVTEPVTGEPFEFDVRSTRLLLQVTLRPLRVVELYGLVGQADLDSRSEDADFDGDFGLAWGGGVRLTLLREREHLDATYFLEGRYLQFESEASGVPLARRGGAPVLADETLRWREWEGRVGVSFRYETARPYLGLRYSDVEADDTIRTGATSSELRLRATEKVGGFVGFAFYFSPARRMGLTVEVSFPDQLSGQVGLRLWF